MIAILSLLFAVLLCTNTYAQDLIEIRTKVKQTNAKWMAKETSVSVLPLHLRKKRLGLIEKKLDVKEKEPPKRLMAVSLPSSFDWRNIGGKNFVSKVKNQNDCGSCWAFATVAALESYILIRENKPDTAIDLAEQIMVDCSRAGNCGGGYVKESADFIRDTGVPPEYLDTYKARNDICPVNGWEKFVKKINSWHPVNFYNGPVESLKAAVYTYGPMPVSMMVWTDFYYYSSGIYHKVSGTVEGSHLILLIGWDDVDQYFTAKNSWGTGWGEGGFFKIAYSEVARQTTSKVEFGSSVVYFDSNGPPPPLPPDNFRIISQYIDYYPESNYTHWYNLYDVNERAYGQSITGDGRTLNRAVWYLRRIKVPTGPIVSKVYAHQGIWGDEGYPVGNPLAVSNTVEASTLPLFPAEPTLIEFAFPTPVKLEKGVHYILVIEFSGGDGLNFVSVGMDITGTHPGNQSRYYPDPWTYFPVKGFDFIFYAISDQ